MLSLDRQNAYRELYRAANPGWQPATDHFAALVREALRPSSRVLDLGCGRGGLVEQLDHPLGQMVGVDADVVSLQTHRLALPRAAAVGRALPFAAASFDVVYASWVLEHLAAPAADLAEVARVLRPDGRFIFITPNARHPLIAVNRLLGRTGAVQRALVDRFYGRAAVDTFPAFYRANTPAILRALAAGAGLRMATLDGVPDPSYLAFSPGFFRLACHLEARLPERRRLHLVGVLARRAP